MARNSWSTPADRYTAAVTETFARAAGHELGPGVWPVGLSDRTRSTVVVYAFADRHLLATSPDRAAELTAALTPEHRPVDRLLDDLAGLGGRRVAEGVNFVHPGLDAVPLRPTPAVVRWLDGASAADRELLDHFYDRCSADDLDEVEIDRERPDPAICVTLDDDGSITGYASGRAFWAMADADDIGVLVRPDRRRQGVGADVVRQFVLGRVGTLPQLYRHDAVNIGSGGVARAVGFEELHRVIAVDFDD